MITDKLAFEPTIVTVTASRHIKRGTFITSHRDGTVRECMTTEALIDPLGDVHFPTIIGYAIDTIDVGRLGRAVIAM